MNKFKEVFCEIFMFLREAGLKKKNKTITQTHMHYTQCRASGQTVKYVFGIILDMSPEH